MESRATTGLGQLGDKFYMNKTLFLKRMAYEEVNSSDGASRAITALCNLGRLGGFCGIYPYMWSKVGDETAVKRQRKREWWYKASTLMLYAYSVFLLARTVSVWRGKDHNSRVKMRMIYMCIVHIPMNGGHYFTLKHFGMHQLVFNEIVQLSRFYGKKCGPSLHGEKLLISMAALVISSALGIINSLEVLGNPRAPRLLSSLVADPGALSRGAKFAFLVIHTYVNALQFFSGTLHACTLLVYAFLVAPKVEQMRYKESRWSRNSTGNLQEQSRIALQIQKDYNRLVVLQQVVRSVYCSWTLTYLIFLMLFVTFNLFQAVDKLSVRSFGLACAELYVLSQICTSCGNIYEKSKKTWESWWKIKNPAWFPHYRRANPPARIPIGSFFYFDKGIVLTFIDIILTSAVNLIVSYSRA